MSKEGNVYLSIPRPETQMRHLLNHKYAPAWPNIQDVSGVTAEIVGKPTPRVVAVLPGIGFRLKDQVDDAYYNPFGMATFLDTIPYCGMHQTIVVSPPKNSRISPLNLEQLTEKTFKALEKELLDKQRVPKLEKITLFAFSQGGYLAAHMLEKYTASSELLRLLDKIILVSPAGVTTSGLERIDRIINKNAKKSITGAFKIQDHWYAGNYFNQLKRVNFLGALENAAKQGIKVTLLPEQPGSYGLLSYEEYNLLLELVRNHKTVELIYPQPNDKHNPDHLNASIKIYQAFRVSPADLDEPVGTWHLDRITKATTSLQTKFNLVEPGRTQSVDWETIFGSRLDYMRVEIRRSDRKISGYAYIPR
ncbi:hypothetical protein HY029_01345 [Candidatus Gottesmanbacteria bacterium]|nr:hypothetical protein [Candidatus Gottesmanbacteria bacterium]